MGTNLILSDKRAKLQRLNPRTVVGMPAHELLQLLRFAHDEGWDESIDKIASLEGKIATLNGGQS